jgi:hypothetical protein
MFGGEGGPRTSRKALRGPWVLRIRQLYFPLSVSCTFDTVRIWTSFSFDPLYFSVFVVFIRNPFLFHFTSGLEEPVTVHRKATVSPTAAVTLRGPFKILGKPFIFNKQILAI